MSEIRVKTTCETEQKIVFRTVACPICGSVCCVEVGKHVNEPHGWLWDQGCPHLEDYNPSTDEWTFETEEAKTQ